MRQTFIAIVLAALVALAVSYFDPFHRVQEHSAVKPEKTIANRVLQTKKLRCGYIVWSPEFIKDPNSGEISGLAYDIITEAAKRLGWAIDWVEEVNFGNMVPALQSGRFDAICFSLYRDAPRANFARLSIPIFYSGTGIFVKADDDRFDTLPTADINNPDFSIATIDGEMSALTAQKAFPNAKQAALPQTSSAADLLMNVATGKADLTLVNTMAGAQFMQANPGQVKNITLTQPLEVFSHGFAFRTDSGETVETLNVVLQEMLDQGFIDKIIDRYSPQQGAYYRVKKNYQ